MKILTAFILGIITAFIVPLIVLWAGWMNFAATSGPGPVEALLMPWGYEQSVQFRAPEEENPFTNDPAAVADGLAHYRDTCLVCHGAPDVERRGFTLHMSPKPPGLGSAEIQKMPDGELFWVIKHGIRMTGMPAFGPEHSDEELWKVAAFVRQLPDLTEQQKQQLRQAGDGGHEHGGGSGSQSSTSGHAH